MKEIDLLFTKLNEYTDYPTSVSNKNGEIKYRAFFPAGNGIYGGSNSFPKNGIMILGQDWGTEKGYDEDLKRGGEPENYPTWKNILKFLEATGLSTDYCFFTNVFMGLRKEGTAYGRFPAFNNKPENKKYLDNCKEFFLYQIEIQKPKLILVLGLRVAEFLAEVSGQLSSWSKINNFKSIDENNNQIKRDIVFNNGVVSNLILLMHPSCRKYNLDTRKYNGETGNNAQIKMTKELLQHIKQSNSQNKTQQSSNKNLTVIPTLKHGDFIVFINLEDLDDAKERAKNNTFINCIVIDFANKKIHNEMNIYQWIKHVERTISVQKSERQEIMDKLLKMFSQDEINKKVFNPLMKVI